MHRSGAEHRLEAGAGDGQEGGIPTKLEMDMMLSIFMRLV